MQQTTQTKTPQLKFMLILAAATSVILGFHINSLEYSSNTSYWRCIGHRCYWLWLCWWICFRSFCRCGKLWCRCWRCNFCNIYVPAMDQTDTMTEW